MSSQAGAVWLDGEVCGRDGDHVARDSRAFRYGDGVFSTLLCSAGRLLAAERHVRQLRRSCDRIGLDAPAPLSSGGELADAVAQLDPQYESYVVRVQVSPRGSGRGFRRSGREAWALVEAFAVPPGRAVRAATQRPDAWLPLPPLPRLKSCSALPHVLAARAASEAGVDELLRIHEGLVTEAVASNVFWLADGILYTPAADLPLYPGVTRETVIEAAGALNVPVEAGRYGPDRLLEADEVLLTNAVRGVETVGELDERQLGTTALGQTLADASLALRFDEGVPMPDTRGK